MFLVPAWRRAITRVIGELDDLEDQIATILWVLEWISRKFIPVPPQVIAVAQRTQRSLDCAEKILAGVTPFRTRKSEYGQCLREVSEARAGARTRKAGLIAWFRANYGRVLEAAQATETWFDVGLVLGPVMGFIEEGLWGAARATLNNYLIAADALLPGIKEDFERNAAELQARVDEAWDTTWGSIEDWSNDQIQRALAREDLTENLLN